MDYFGARVLYDIEKVSGVPPRGLDNGHMLLGDSFKELLRHLHGLHLRQHGDIHAEGLVRQVPHTVDLIHQIGF